MYVSIVGFFAALPVFYNIDFISCIKSDIFLPNNFFKSHFWFQYSGFQ